MAISLQGTAVSSAQASGGVSFALPTWTVAPTTDHVWAFVDVQDFATVIDLPSSGSWTLVAATTGTTDRHEVWRKAAATGDSGSTVTTSLTGAGGGNTIRRMIQTIAVRSADPGPHATPTFTAFSGASNTHTIPSLNATVANWGALIHGVERIAVASSDYTWSSTTPTTTEQVKQTQTGSSQFFAETATIIGSTSIGTVAGGTATGNASPTAPSNGGVWLIVLSPAGTPPATYVPGQYYKRTTVGATVVWL